MAHAAEFSLRDLPAPRPDLVIISPNDPVAMRQHVEECRELGLKAYSTTPASSSPA